VNDVNVYNMYQSLDCAFCNCMLHDVFVIFHVRSVDVHVSVVLYIVHSMHDLFDLSLFVMQVLYQCRSNPKGLLQKHDPNKLPKLW
jgi:hypothetical protein